MAIPPLARRGGAGVSGGWFEIRIPLIAGVLGLLWWLESAAPLFLERRGRPARMGRHLVLGLLNGILVTPLLSIAAWLASTHWFQDYGLFAWLRLPLTIEVLLAVVLIDLWMYAWHRANHSIPLLWRFHRVHHSDRELDSTSAFRFHTGEVVLSAVFRLALIPLLSIQLWQLLLYELLMLPVILLHHSNINMPARLDRALRSIIVTPWMHWVHHSSYRPETDSNFSTIFSFWDRLFSTFRLVDEPRTIRFGLDEFRDTKWHGLKGLLLTPFVSSPRSEGADARQANETLSEESRTESLVHGRRWRNTPDSRVSVRPKIQNPDDRKVHDRHETRERGAGGAIAHLSRL